MSASVVMVTATLLAGVVGADGAPPVVKGWGVLMQAVKAVEGYVGSGELSSVHNEDMMLSSAISVLRAETRRASPGRQEAAARALSTLAQQIGDLHQAADAFDAATAKVRLQRLLATYAELQRLYGQDVLAPARRLAAVWTCPMHPEVLGKSSDQCPKCGMVLDQPARIPLFFSGRSSGAAHRAREHSHRGPPGGRPARSRATLRLTQLTGAPILITRSEGGSYPADPSADHRSQPDRLSPRAPSAHRQARRIRLQLHPAHGPAPTEPGPILRTTYGGFQEYATTDIHATTRAARLDDCRLVLRADAHGLRFALGLDRRDDPDR